MRCPTNEDIKVLIAPDPLLPPVLVAVFKAAFPKALQTYQERQASKAQAAIAEQLSKGKPWAITDDKAAAAMWRYLRAAMEGAARRNLDLLAEALVNGAIDPEFAPDEFKRQADRLEGLNRKEIVVLAAFLRTNQLPPLGSETALVTRFAAATKDAMASGLFEGEEDVDLCMSGLTRTGWVAPANGFGFSGYRLTSELLKLSVVLDLEAAAARQLHDPAQD